MSRSTSSRVWVAVALLASVALPVLGGCTVGGARILAHLMQVEPHPIAERDMHRAQAIAVLGGRRERVHEAASLHLATGLPVLLVGRGTGDAPFKAESEKMAWVLRTQYAIEPRWVETRSRDTHQNAEFAWCMVAPQGVTHVVLVTSARHMRRARSEFEAVGFDVIPAPMPDADEPVMRFTFADFIPSRRGIALAARPLKEWAGTAAANLLQFLQAPPDCSRAAAGAESAQVPRVPQ